MKYILFTLITIFASSAYAEIHREATVCQDTGEICFYWWPVLPEIDKWQQVKAVSYKIKANVQAPIGFNFQTAESIVYAKAIYKLKQPESKTLGEFINNDKEQFLKDTPSLIISEAENLTTGAGQQLRSFIFSPKTQGNWEKVSYGEETDKDGNEYYLVFVLSSQSKTGFKKTLPIYNEFIYKYK